MIDSNTKIIVYTNILYIHFLFPPPYNPPPYTSYILTEKDIYFN
jgi:hypothetical protein